MVNFATDPGTDTFLRGIDAGERARKARTAVAVDAAVRRGLAAAQGGNAAAPPALAPVPAVDAVTPPAAPATPPAPALAPAPRGAPPAAVAAPMRGRGGEPLEGSPDAPPVPTPALPPPPPPPPAPAPRAAGPALAPPPAVAGGPQPVGDRYENVLRELARVEGGGAAALGVMQQQDRRDVATERRRDQLARLSMYALKQGDVATGQYFANQAGIPLPQIQPGRGRGGAGGNADVTQAKVICQAALDAKKIYGHNQRQAEAYFRTFIETGGDRTKAIEAARSIPDPVWRQDWVFNEQTGQSELYGFRRDGSSVRITDDDGQPFVRAPQQRVVQTEGGYATVNPQSGAARPVTGADGQPIQAPPRGGAAGPRAGGRPLDREVRRQMLVEAGLSPQEAALVAGGGTLTPAARAQILFRIQTAVGADALIPENKKAAEIERRYNDIIGRLGGGASAPTLPRAPADAPALAPTPAPQIAPALPAGVREGQRIRQGGVIYQVRNGQLVPVQ